MADAKTTCSIDGCETRAVARGWCPKHWSRWRNHGDPQKTLPRKSAERDCSVDGCERPYSAKGYCGAHYRNWRRTGDPIPRKMALISKRAAERAAQACGAPGCKKKVSTAGHCAAHYRNLRIHGALEAPRARYDDPYDAVVARTEWRGGCLVWTGPLGAGGYGVVTVGGRNIPAHRYVFGEVVEQPPADMFVDHKCWNRACVNPAHLRLATPAENNTYRHTARCDSTTGFRNVLPYRGRKDAWKVKVRKNGRTYGHVHYNLEDALAEAEALRNELFGEYAGKG